MEHVDPTLSWFASRVERGREQPFSEIVEITPDIAKRLMEVNDSNRRINQRTIDRLAHDIRTSQWRLNGDAVIVSKDGRLNTGQHRMLAVLAAGKPIKTWVTFGVDRDSRFTLNLRVIDRYSLDGRTPVPEPDLMRWAMWLETADRRVALTDHELFRVSTVFLGLDHNFSRTGPPILFETMAFSDDLQLDGDTCQRYATWEDAEIGHQAMVERLMKMARASSREIT